MERPLTERIRPGAGPVGLREYERAGGYEALRKALSGMTPYDVRREVKQAGLRGRGGAGFPTGAKWNFMPGPDQRRPHYLCVNADEMEPGAFKDRYLIEGDPHQLVEGTIISAYAVAADVAYIFLRWEYAAAAKALAQAIAEARAAGYVGHNILGSGYSLQLELHVSAGRYMCGEETGLLNAIQGRRPTPRTKPPHPQAVGLWGQPSVVNNVETVCNVPHIIRRGWEWFKKLSRTDEGGTKLYGLSGQVNRPGLWEMPMGTTLRELLGLAGGMRPGRAFKGAQPGGASTAFVTDQHLDVPMDFAQLEQAGSRLGTGTAIVLDDRTCVVGMCENMMRFFARESCGWCTPCREGLPWTRDILAAMEAGRGRTDDIEELEQHARFWGPGLTFCALAAGAAEPLGSALKHWRKDFERHVELGRCPWA